MGQFLKEQKVLSLLAQGELLGSSPCRINCAIGGVWVVGQGRMKTCAIWGKGSMAWSICRGVSCTGDGLPLSQGSLCAKGSDFPVEELFSCLDSKFYKASDSFPSPSLEAPLCTASLWRGGAPVGWGWLLLFLHPPPHNTPPTLFLLELKQIRPAITRFLYNSLTVLIHVCASRSELILLAESSIRQAAPISAI